MSEKSTPSEKNITAAIIIIGNEILSGRTQDANAAFIANRLSLRGITLHEIRVVRDDRAAIIATVNALRARYTYIFTTGGIGPTHDDITASCIAEAFGVPHVIDAGARARLVEYYAPSGTELNEARLRMATLPQGSALIDNPVSGAPGFKIGNVFVMAGIPKVMRAMFDHVETMIEGGAVVLSSTVACNMREGDIAHDLGDIQNDFLDIDIGSYPHTGGGGAVTGPSLSIVLRGTEEGRLTDATLRVADMIRKRGDEPRISGIKN